ncbi:hypothetical protein BS47DRAFT_1469346, partial [Hydnum rufescens UP504]
IIDYSGGYVLHVSLGTARFIGASWIGPRLDKDRLEHKPHNTLLVLVGPGILWSDWNRFSDGDPSAASTDAGAAVLNTNTNIATATSALVWITWATIYYKKPSVLGGVNDMIAGLVAISPAAGVVAGWGAIVIGIALR